MAAAAASSSSNQGEQQSTAARQLTSRERARIGGGQGVPEVGNSREWQQHSEWTQKLWRRMDRNGSGVIERRELDCEEFRSVLHRVLAPQAPRSTSYHGRAQINFKQALHYCLRKADLNNDGVLSYEEFRALMWSLRWPSRSEDSSTLLFALFDLDGDQLINREEFRQMYRFYMGSDPAEEEFQHTWFEVSEGRFDVAREEYVKWLQRTSNVVFKQHAPPRGHMQNGMPQSSTRGDQAADEGCTAEDDNLQHSSGSQSSPSLRDARRSKKKSSGAGKSLLPASHPLARRRNSLYSLEARPRWNQNISPKVPNEEIAVKSMRHYFSAPESLATIQKFYQKRPGFKQLVGNPVLAAQVRYPTPGEGHPLRTGHHKRGGRMRDQLTGKVVPWNDYWQSPQEVKYVPTIEGKGLLQPPSWLWRSRFEYDAEDEPF
mmetsp:Transcript_75984/g.180753  ORF Transcript_75984/g.180753 Transcript_75984/m.180753 type:complete len:431 (-) Transcript_75984:124-1416(-)